MWLVNIPVTYMWRNALHYSFFRSIKPCTDDRIPLEGAVVLGNLITGCGVDFIICYLCFGIKQSYNLPNKSQTFKINGFLLGSNGITHLCFLVALHALNIRKPQLLTIIPESVCYNKKSKIWEGSKAQRPTLKMNTSIRKRL